LLLDHDVDLVTAMITSVRPLVVNPASMLGWGFTVRVLLVRAALPFLRGLIVVVSIRGVVLSILGYATWHLYRRVVDPVAT
jgi:uncharacterized membrane protein